MWKNDIRAPSVPALRPLPSRTALLSSSMTNCVTTATAKLRSGKITRGMANFESTVVRSETGSDFQNRMLRSRRSHVAKRGELLAFDTIEQQDAAPEHLAFVNRLQRPCCGDLLGIHHHFQIARLEFFHAAIEHHAAAVNEHDIGQDVLNLFHLM